MKRQPALLILAAACAFAQGRGGADWTTGGGDAQRSSWVRSDPKISVDNLRKPGFDFLWKLKLDDSAKQAFAAPVLLNSYIGYRGFRSLAFVGVTSDKLVGIDTDLGRIEWQQKLPSSAGCPGTMPLLTRPTPVAFPNPAMGRGGFGGRGGPAKSGVGEPGEGAVTLNQMPAAANRGPANFPGGRAPGRGPNMPPGGFGRMPSLVYAITGDGMLHGLYVSNGEPSHAAIPFLPANTAARELIVIDNVAYAAAAPSCNAAPDSLIAIDVVSKEAARWKPESGTILGPAFGPDGTAYVTTSQGDLFALEPKTLAVKSRYRSEQGFAASPVLFEYQDKALIAAASKDGRIQVFDTAALDKPLASSAVGGAAPGSLATWQDQAGTRWILGATPDAVVAWKFTPAIERAWASRDIASPLAPIVVNGVVFTASPTTLYALDGATGAPLWNSGRTIAAPIRGGGLSAGGSQLYLGSSDGTLYVFGFPIEH